MLRKFSVLFNWVRGYGLGDPARNGEYHFMSSCIRAHMVLFDVGANVGDYTERALSLAHDVRVHCFEPVPATFKALEARFTSDPRRDRVRLNNVGLGDQVGTATMRVYGPTAGSNSLYERRSALGAHPEFTEHREQAVSLTTLDAYVTAEAVQRIDLLKIDVEGHELKVLRGATHALAAGVVKTIQFEYGGCFLDAGTRLEQVFDLLSGNGYSIFRLLPFGKTRVRSFSPKLENYCYSNWVAIRS